MILVTGVLVIDPTKLDRATELVSALTEATRAEPGNVDYSFAQVLGEAGRLVITEKWESQEAIDGHMAAPHFLEFMGAAGELGVSQAEIHQYEISSHKQVM